MIRRIRQQGPQKALQVHRAWLILQATMGWRYWLVLAAGMQQTSAWFLALPLCTGSRSPCTRGRRIHRAASPQKRRPECAIEDAAVAGRAVQSPAAGSTIFPVGTARGACGVDGQQGNPSASNAAPIWSHAQFSITLAPYKGPHDRGRAITKAVTNGLAPLLEGVEEGAALLRVLNDTAALGIAPRAMGPPLSTLPAVALTLRDGKVEWDTGQDLWLSHKEDGSTPDSEADSFPSQRGSARYDFSVIWPNTDGGGDAPSKQREALRGLHDGRDEAREDDAGRESLNRAGRKHGPGGGHVVGELRPLQEFSAARQRALDEALKDLGVDPGELAESDEFFGTAALKAYNTFVRPRPKQLSKVMQEPVTRAALRTAHQVAFLVRRHRADRAEYLRNKDASMTEKERRGLRPHPVVLVCDNVRSAYNVGSIFRSADTARVAEVISCGFTPHPGGHGEDKLRKTAFGSLDVVTHRHFQDPVDAIASLKAAGSVIFALETTKGASSMFDVTFPLPPAPAPEAKAQQSGGGVAARSETRNENGGAGSNVSAQGHAGELTTSWGVDARELRDGAFVALVLGNEVTGVDERVLELCDLVIEIPVYGLKNSLNVASAATVVLYEVLRQWSTAGRLLG